MIIHSSSFKPSWKTFFTRHCEGGVAKRKMMLHLVSHSERSFCIILFDALHYDIITLWHYNPNPNPNLTLLHYDITLWLCRSWTDWVLKDKVGWEPQIWSWVEGSDDACCQVGVDGSWSRYLVSSLYILLCILLCSFYTVQPSLLTLPHLHHLCWADLIGYSELKKRDVCVTGQRVSIRHPATFPQLTSWRSLFLFYSWKEVCSDIYVSLIKDHVTETVNHHNFKDGQIVYSLGCISIEVSSLPCSRSSNYLQTPAAQYYCQWSQEAVDI